MKLSELADNAGRAQDAAPRRPRHRLRQGQDRRARRQGPEGAHRRRRQRLRRRPDAAAPPPAQARLQERLGQELQRGQPRPHPAGDRRRQARSRRRPIDVAALVKAGVLRRAKDGVRLLGDGELKAKVAFAVAGASKSAVAAVEKAGGIGARSSRPSRRRTSRRPDVHGVVVWPRAATRDLRSRFCHDRAPHSIGSGYGDCPARAGRNRRAGSGQRGAGHGLCSRTTGGQPQLLGPRQGRGAEEAHLVHARRAAGLPARHLHPAARHRPVRLGSDLPQPGRRHPRHVQHVRRRRHPAHGDLRAEHHAVHLGLDHPPADDDGVADARAAQEGGRAGPQDDQSVHPLSHRGAGGVPGLRHRDRAGGRRQRHLRSRLVLPHLRP